MPTELDRAFDLIIVDGISATLPARSRALFIAPIADTPVFSVGAVFSATAFAEAFSHPMLRGVDWRGINILDGRLVNGPAWLRPIITSQGGPLVLAGEPPPLEGRSPDFERLAIISFDLRRSDLPLQIAFPVLIANTVEWLAPLRGLDIASAIRPGEVVALPQGATVINPSGKQFTVDARGFAATSEPGIYGYAAGGANGRFAVNFISAQESGIAPAALSFSAPSEPGAGLASGATAQREIWPVLAGLALAALIVEWWIYQRGVPSLRRRAATQGTK